MRSRSGNSMSGASVMGVFVGLAAGAAVGLLTAPMRGSDMRATLRSRAEDALSRCSRLLEEGRDGWNRRDSRGISHLSDTAPATLTAPLGEIAQLHQGIEPFTTEARS